MAVLTYRLTLDSSDLKTAIRGIHDLALQTKRQADSSGQQLYILQRQFNEMQAQTRALQGSEIATKGMLAEQERSQEPLITSSHIAQPFFQIYPDAPDRGRLSWNVPFSNTGRSTAVVTSQKSYLKIEAGKFKCVQGCGKQRESTLPPGPEYFMTPVWPPLIDKAEFDRLMQKELAIYVIVDFSFNDPAGHRKSTRICWGRFANGAIQNCAGAFGPADFE